MQVIKTWEENTNNAWGFGGYNATFTEYDNGIIVRKGRYSHRHTGTSSANALFVKISKNFLLRVRHVKELEKLGGVISIFHDGKEGHYVAIPKDVDTHKEYGEEYILFKKIQVS